MNNLDLNKTISQQITTFNGYDVKILVTLKGSGKSYLMEHKIVDNLKAKKNTLVVRNNEINITKAVIGPLTTILSQNNMLYSTDLKIELEMALKDSIRGIKDPIEVKRLKDELKEKLNNLYKITKLGVFEADTNVCRVAFGYMSSPTALDGCNLKAEDVFYDEFLMKDNKNGVANMVKKNLNEDFWRMTNTCTRPNKPSIWCFANPHSPTCLNNDFIYNRVLDFNINWDALSKDKIQQCDERTFNHSEWGEMKCGIWVVPVDFKTMNSASNEFMDMMTGNKMFRFAGNSKKKVVLNKPADAELLFNVRYDVDNVLCMWKSGDMCWVTDEYETGDIYSEELAAEDDDDIHCDFNSPVMKQIKDTLANYKLARTLRYSSAYVESITNDYINLMDVELL